MKNILVFLTVSHRRGGINASSGGGDSHIILISNTTIKTPFNQKSVLTKFTGFLHKICFICALSRNGDRQRVSHCVSPNRARNMTVERGFERVRRGDGVLFGRSFGGCSQAAYRKQYSRKFFRIQSLLRNVVPIPSRTV
jgi:hypothetical protein